MTSKNPLAQVAEFGQSIWFDNITRKMVSSGELAKMIDEDGLRGVTSNPSIFEKAIGSSADYDRQIREILVKNPKVDLARLFEELAVEDISSACDALKGVYDRTKGLDGYVSIEVNPELAHETQKTIDEARRLWKSVGRPNVMIKIPATDAGLPAVRTCISEGMNINITLMFSKKDYDNVTEAYISGLEDRAKAGGDLSKIRSVASFFVSRIDSAVDDLAEKAGKTELLAKTGIANAKMVYKRSKEVWSSDRFKKLAAKGAHLQRLLWASTGTKNPKYSDVLYLEALMGPDTVDTVPPATYAAFKDHGKPDDRLSKNLDEAVAFIGSLKKHGIDFDAVTKKIKDDGVAAFTKSYSGLMTVLKAKRESMLK